MTDEPFEVIKTTRVSLDWAEINRLKRGHKKGGQEAQRKAMAELAAARVLCVGVLGAFFPDIVREGIEDALSEAGKTVKDLELGLEAKK